MPRRPRLEVTPGIFHVNARGNRRQPIVLGEADAAHFLDSVGMVVDRFRWRCHAFCVVPNHYHLLLETTSPNLGDGMRQLNGDYARWFNRRYEFGGHLFQGRFHSATVESDSHLVELSRYIVLNPVRAGLCRRAEDWPWSSYRATVGLAPIPPFLTVDRVLRYFGRSRRLARRRYAAFVADAPR
jgi:putative transposase